MGKKEEQICPNEKWKPELCILMALKMNDDNLFDDKSSLQASYRYFYFQPTHGIPQSWLELYDQYVIDFDIDFKSH